MSCWRGWLPLSFYYKEFFVLASIAPLFVTHAAPYPLRLLTLLLKESQPFELKPSKLRCLMLASHCCWWRTSARAASLALLRRSLYADLFPGAATWQWVGMVQTPEVGRQARAPGRSRLETPQHPLRWRGDSNQLLRPYEDLPLRGIQHKVLTIVPMTQHSLFMCQCGCIFSE